MTIPLVSSPVYGWVSVRNQVLSSVAAVNFTLTNTYKSYKIIMIDLVYSSSSSAVNLQFGTGVGPSWDTGSNYEYVGQSQRTGASGAHAFVSSSDTSVNVSENGISNVSNTSTNYEITLFNPNSSAYKLVRINASGYNGSGFTFLSLCTATWRSATAATGVRLLVGAGTFSGRATLFGLPT